MSMLQLPGFRRDLSASGPVKTVGEFFDRIDDPVKGRKATLSDCLNAAPAMFMFKFPSMFAFDGTARGPTPKPQLARNLRTLFRIRHVPCDTAMRERLDPIDPQSLRPVFKRLFSLVQRGGGLKELRWELGGHLAALDGTEFFNSQSFGCPNRCLRVRRNGNVERFHRMAAASVVSPDRGDVLPMMPEMVRRADGASKNDCESAAVKRLLPAIRREHPHLELTILMDAPHGKAPQVRQLRELGMSYIIGAKPGDRAALFGQLEIDGESHVVERDDGRTWTFRWRNGAELDDSSRDLLVNVLECAEHTPERKVRKAGGRTRTVDARTVVFGWITGHEITVDKLVPLMRAGRSRWRVENEVFQTLKRQGLNPGHNCGHGKENPAEVLALPMPVAFAIDKIQELCCRAFNAALKVVGSRVALWSDMRAHLKVDALESREHLTLLLARAPPET